MLKLKSSWAAVGAAFSLLACAPAWAQAPANPPPVSAFAALPAMRMLALSPDGQRLLGLVNRDGNTVLVTAKWDGSEMRGIMETDNRKFVFNWVSWVSNERLIASLRFPAVTRGGASTETRALAMDIDGGRLINLVPPPRDNKSDKLAQFQDRIIDWMPEDGHHVLMSLVEDFSVWAPSVFKVNVDTGKRTQVLGPRRDVWTWITDQQHRVRVGVKETDAVYQVLVRDVDSDNWRTVWEYPAFSAETVTPLRFGPDPQQLYVEAQHEGKSALFRAQLDKKDANGRPEMTLIWSDDRHDFDGVLQISRKTGEILAIGEPGLGDAARMFLSEPLRELARGVDQALPNRWNWIGGRNDAGTRYFVGSSGNGVPGEFYVGDRQAGTLSLLAESYPQLKGVGLVGKKSIEFKARDGLLIKGFLTVPRGSAPGGWPLVLLPHGGPISSDNAGFDTWTEFLASRGYAVLQVNFRGSDGLGTDFRNAGLRRWGLEMQDDLTDGVKWAIDQKLADPKRVCVVGASYGGYAALMGAVKTPELYRCAVSFAGVSNLIDLSRYQQGFVNAAIADKQIGNYWRDRDQLKKTSPSERAAEIQVPVLLIHGTQDRSVPYDQSETMAKALKSAGKSFKFVTLTDGDHHLSRQADRLQFFTELEAFLAQNLPANPVK